MSKINIEYGEQVFSGRIRACLDFTFREICIAEPKITESERKAIREWAENAASMRHTEEHEFIIPLVPSDSEFVDRLNPPECLRGFLYACLEYAKKNEKEVEGEIDLRLFL